MIAAVRNAFTRYLFWINTLADMPRYFVVTWTLLFALFLLFMIVIGIGLLVRAAHGS
jgi:hypothetical protein